VDDGVRFEQDPEEIWTALTAAVRILLETIDASAVQAIGIVGQSPTLVWVDANARPLGPMLGWRDVRAASHAAAVSEAMSPEWQREHLGYVLPISAGFTPTRLSWYAAKHPGMVADAHAALSLKDFAVFRLTGEVVTDPINARGVAHCVTGESAADIADILGIPAHVLPPVRMPWETAGQLAAEVADEIGLPVGVPVAVGWGDLLSAMLAAGILSDGADYDITGTAEAAGQSGTTALDVPGLLGIPLTTEKAVTYGSTQAGGGSAAWLLSSVLTHRDQSWLDTAVSQRLLQRPPSTLFLPHLGGERAPLWDPSLRGTFLGLDGSHDDVDIARAVLEGVAMSVRQIITRIDSVRGNQPERPFIIAGAASGNAAWNQIKADVLGRALSICDLDEPSAFGAAVLACATIDDQPAWDVAAAWRPTLRHVEPRTVDRRSYDELFAAYDQSTAVLSPLHQRLAAIRAIGRNEPDAPEETQS
jgi:xylulokinase